MISVRNGRSHQVWLTVALCSAAGVALAQEPAGVSAAAESADAAAAQGVVATDFFGADNRSELGKAYRVDYGFTTANNCVRATPHPPSIVGIDPDTRVLLVPGQAITQSGGGVIHLFRDGTLTLEATASEVNFAQNAPGDSPQTTGLDGTCKGSWSRSKGNAIQTHFNCHIDIPSQHVSFDLGPTNTHGFINTDGSSINLNQDDDLQKVTLSLPNGAKLVTERVCTQRFALNRVGAQAHRWHDR